MTVKDLNLIKEDVIRMLASNKDPDLDQAVKLVLADSKLLDEILKGMFSKKETYRYNCYKVLFRISRDAPRVLYPEWDYFIELICSPNSYHRMAAVEIIANLTSIDTENKFEGIFDQYFSLLDDKSIITAIHTAQNAGKIATTKDHLLNKITERLLSIDGTHYAQDRKDLIKAGAIQSLEEIFEPSLNKERILAFVREQLACRSTKTRKVAKNFLDTYG